MEAQIAEVTKEIEVQKEQQKQLSSGFTKHVCEYLQLINGENEKVAESFDEKLLDIEMEVARLTFIDVIKETAQKTQKAAGAAANRDCVEIKNDELEEGFLTKKFEEIFESIEKSKKLVSVPAQFELRKLSKKKQELYEECFKLQLDSRDNKLRLIADEGVSPTDRETNQLRAFHAMKLQRLELLNDQKTGKDDRKAVLQKRKELLQHQLKDLSSTPEAQKKLANLTAVPSRFHSQGSHDAHNSGMNSKSVTY